MIYHIIKIKRGLLANLPTLSAGELAYTTDTKELYIGTSTGTNIRLTYDGVELDIDALEADLNEAFTRNYAQDKKLEDLERSIKSSLVGDYFGSLDIAGLVEHLPATVAKAPLKVAGKGLSLEQSVLNGYNFSATTNWTAASSSGTLSVSGSNLLTTGTGTAATISTYQTINITPVAGNIYHVKARIRVTDAVCQSLNLYLGDNTVGAPSSFLVATQASPTQNTWYILEGNITLTTQVGLLRVYLTAAYADLATANGKVVELNEATNHKLTNTPLASYTADQLKALALPYFEGRKDIVNPTVEAVGKNLFDGELRNGSYLTTDGSFSTSIDNFANVNPIYVKPSTTYKIKDNLGTWNYRLFYYDINGNFISCQLGSTGETTVTVPANCAYMNFRIYLASSGSTIPTISIQLEQGTVATTYEPYAKQSKTFVGTFRSVGSVQDEFRDGVKVKKVGADINDVVQSATSWGSANILTNTKQYYKNLASSLLYKIVSSNGIIANISLRIGTDVYNVVTNTALASTDTEKLICIDVAGNLGIRVNKTTYPDSASFEAYLQANDVEFIYELANPVEEPISILGSSILMGEPRGQIRQTSLNGAVDIYSAPTGIVVTDPIEEVTELIKLNAEGVQELLDLSNVTIAGDSLSFTSTDLSEGDAIYYTYKPIEARINGSLSIDYYTNDVVVDDVTGDIYKWSVAASNGVLSLEGEVIG
jgi:hypothetical protein